MRLRNYRLSIALGVVAALGCTAGLISTSARAVDVTNIVIKDFKFSPESLTIKAGSTVTWVNTDDEPHNVVSDAGLFRSGGFDTNETFVHKFDKPGTFHITCSIHPRMTATIVVE